MARLAAKCDNSRADEPSARAERRSGGILVLAAERSARATVALGAKDFPDGLCYKQGAPGIEPVTLPVIF
jgi:hypothetical protein